MIHCQLEQSAPPRRQDPPTAGDGMLNSTAGPVQKLSFDYWYRSRRLMPLSTPMPTLPFTVVLKSSITTAVVLTSCPFADCCYSWPTAMGVRGFFKEISSGENLLGVARQSLPSADPIYPDWNSRNTYMMHGFCVQDHDLAELGILNALFTDDQDSANMYDWC